MNVSRHLLMGYNRASAKRAPRLPAFAVAMLVALVTATAMAGDGSIAHALRQAFGGNVQAAGATDGQALVWNATTGTWGPSTVTASQTLAQVLATGADGNSVTQTNLGSLTLASGKAITGGTLSWTSWTPTGSWTANTTYAGYFCVVGKILHLRITVTTSGAPTATNLAITNLPGSYVADETAMLAPTTGATLGMGTIIDSGTMNYGYVMARWADGPNTIPLVVLNTTAGQFQNVTDTFPMAWGASDQLQFTAMVPIQ